MMNLVLKHHHENSPARERAGRVDHLDLTSKPLRWCVMKQVPKPTRRRLQPRNPCPSVITVQLRRHANPTLAAVSTREIQTRAADVAHDVTDAPAGFPGNGGRAPRSGSRW